MHTIVIGDEEEYGHRLMRFLENRLAPDDCIFRFSDPDKFLARKMDASVYLFGNDFLEAIPEEDRPKDHMILITGDENPEKEDSFLRYEDPYIQLGMIQKKIGEDGTEGHAKKACITALYCPIYVDHLRERMGNSMEEESLYLGMEDLKESSEQGKDMGDLCYYIKLGSEDIIERMQGMLAQDGKLSYLDSPKWYYDLGELGVDDYRWFFAKLKGQEQFEHVYVAIGNGFVREPSRFQLFDRIILIDREGSSGTYGFNDRLEKLVEENRWSSCQRVEIPMG